MAGSPVTVTSLTLPARPSPPTIGRHRGAMEDPGTVTEDRPAGRHRRPVPLAWAIRQSCGY